MTESAIPSTQRLKRLARLSDRKVRSEEGLTLFEGTRLVIEALKAGRAQQLFVRDKETAERFHPLAGGVPIFAVGAQWMERLADVKSPQEVIAIGSLEEPIALAALLQAHSKILALEHVQDPGNAGTLARSALALGCTGLWLSDGTADPASPKVLRASAGALFHLPRAHSAAEEFLAACRSSGHQVIVPVVRGGQDVRTFAAPQRFCLVAGNEGAGSRLDLGASGITPLTIPMASESESLNVAAAISVILGRWLAP